MASSTDRFYQFEFRDREATFGDLGSLIKICGLIVDGGGESRAYFTLPGTPTMPAKVISKQLSVEEWDEFIKRSDDPEILIGPAKTFQRKVRYEISGTIQQKVWAADQFECLYCRAKMGDRLMTIDHFMPLELGGANDVTNYLTACRPCNKDKANEMPEPWLTRRSQGYRYPILVEYLQNRVIK